MRQGQHCYRRGEAKKRDLDPESGAGRKFLTWQDLAEKQ
jgi:hypothetical protein